MTFDHLGHHFALQRRLYELVHGIAVETEVGQIIGPQPDVDFIDLADRLDNQRTDPVHRAGGGFDAVGRLLQHIQVVAGELDGNLCRAAGDQVRNEVGQRLLHFDIHAHDFVLDGVLQQFQHLLPRLAAVRVDGDEEFVFVRWVGMFVHFGSTGTSAKGQDLALRIGR